MSNPNRILILVGLSFAALYFAEVIVYLRIQDSNATGTWWHAGVAVFLVVLGGFGIESVRKFTLSVGKLTAGLETERHQPATLELELATQGPVGMAKPETEEETLVLAKKAEERENDERSATDYLVLAKKAWRSNDFENAIDLANQGLRLKPASAKLRASLTLCLGLSYKAVGARDLAESLYRRAIAEDPDLSKAHSALGLILSQAGRMDEAEKQYRKAISIDPKDVVAHNNLGNLFSQTGRLDEAEKELRKAISIDPNHARAHYALGMLFAKTGRPDEAREEKSKAALIDPSLVKDNGFGDH